MYVSYKTYNDFLKLINNKPNNLRDKCSNYIIVYTKASEHVSVWNYRKRNWWKDLPT